MALLQRGDAAHAEPLLRSILARHPGHFDSLHLLGVCRGQQGNHDEARALIEEALRRNPRSAEALTNRGFALAALNRHQEAIASYEQALAINPDLFDALYNRGNSLKALNRYGEAVASLDRALQIKPDHADAHNNRGNALQALGRHEEAIATYDKALAIKPDHMEAHWNSSLALLTVGNFRRGWEEYEWRMRSMIWDAPRAVDRPVWTGTSLEGQVILVRGEQGLGDQIMFASCLPEIIARAKLCVVEIDSRLTKLFGRSFPNARTYAFAPKGPPGWVADDIKVDCQVQLGSLPQRLAHDRDSLAKHPGYLVADPARVLAWRSRLDRLGPGPKVGISWRGGTPRTRGATRSVPLALWSPVLRARAYWVSLQYGECQEEIEALARAEGVTVHHWREAIDDYDETGALVGALDLVISVQTAVVHLAGALGRPVWVMVPANPEWRYLAHGETMPWYPTARLFRQPALGDWQSVIERVRRELVSTFGVAPDEGAAASADVPRLARHPSPAESNAPPSVELTNNRASGLAALSLHEETVVSHDKALSIELNSAEVLLVGTPGSTPATALGAKEFMGEGLAKLTQPPGKAPRRSVSDVLSAAAALLRSGKTKDAEPLFHSVLAEDPNCFDALHLLGVCRAQQGDYTEACALIADALAHNSRSAEAYLNYVLALNYTAHYDEAISNCDKLLAIRPTSAKAYFYRGNALQGLRRHAEAVASYDQAILLQPAFAPALYNRGNALKALDQHEKAIASYEEALQADPLSVEALNNRGTSLQALDCSEDAIESYNQALAIAPDSAELRYNRALARLLIGDLAAGWEDYEWRWRRPGADARRYDFAVWNGDASRPSRVLLWGEQGVGDQIIYASMVPDLVWSPMTLTLEVDARLVPLYQRSFPQMTVLPQLAPRAANPAAHDCHAPFASLGRWLRPSFDAFPKHNGYLKANSALVKTFSSSLRRDGAERLVGISWYSRNRHFGANKSTALVDWGDILKVPGVRFVDLQYGDTAGARNELRQHLGLRITHLDDVDLYNDLEALAALCEACDLVITVCNVTAHMAGALGKSVWILVPKGLGNLWYWFSRRDDSPWYPTARLFRQPALGDWQSVIEEVRRELVSFAADAFAR